MPSIDVTLLLNNHWVKALTLYISCFVGLQIFKSILLSRFQKIISKTPFTWDDMAVKAVQQIGWPFYWVLPLFITSQLIELPATITSIISNLSLVIGTFYVAKTVQIFVVKAISNYVSRHEQEDQENKQTIGIFLEIISKIILWSMAVVLILQNLGFNVTALLGGLGVAGIAIGFALQNVLGDVFAFFSLYFDKPFQVGNFIIVGEDMGTVQKIGIKSTRIKTLTGQELIISNRQLTENRVQNFKRMKKRRVEFNFSIPYETPVTKVKQVNQIVTKIFENLDQVELSRVHFKTLGETSLIFEVVYIVQQSDYTLYMDIRQHVNLELMERLAAAKIKFAYPTQVVHVSK